MEDLLEKLKYSYFKNTGIIGRFQILKDYLDADFSFLDYEDNYGNNIFYYLVINCDDKLLEAILLLCKQYNKRIIFKPNVYGATPLFYLRDIKEPFKHIKEIKNILNLLIKYGCNIEKRNESGKLFYHDLADYQFYFIFEELNKLGINYYKQIPSNGFNVLHIACKALNRLDFYLDKPLKYHELEIPYLKTIKEICNSQIDINQKTLIDKTAYDFALESRNINACWLVKKLPPNDLTYGIELHDAALYGYRDIVLEYIKRGVSLDTTYIGSNSDLKDLTPLEIAAKNLQADVIEVLLNEDASLVRINPLTSKSAFYYFAKSLLISAVSIKGDKTKENYKRITRLFLSIPSFINSYIDDDYHTPLNFLASIANRFSYYNNSCLELEIFYELLKKDPDLETRDINGNTVIHNLFLNASNEAYTMFSELKSFNINYNLQNKDGETPLMLLRNVYREEEALMFLEDIKKEDVDFSLVNKDSKDVVTLMLEARKEKLAQRLLELGGA